MTDEEKKQLLAELSRLSEEQKKQTVYNLLHDQNTKNQETSLNNGENSENLTKQDLKEKKKEEKQEEKLQKKGERPPKKQITMSRGTFIILIIAAVIAIAVVALHIYQTKLGNEKMYSVTDTIMNFISGRRTINEQIDGKEEIDKFKNIVVNCDDGKVTISEGDGFYIIYSCYGKVDYKVKDGTLELKFKGAGYNSAYNDIQVTVPEGTVLNSVTAAAKANSVSIHNIEIKDIDYTGEAANLYVNNVTYSTLYADIYAGTARITNNQWEKIIGETGISIDAGIAAINAQQVKGDITCEVNSGEVDIKLPTDLNNTFKYRFEIKTGSASLTGTVDKKYDFVKDDKVHKSKFGKGKYNMNILMDAGKATVLFEGDNNFGF